MSTDDTIRLLADEHRRNILYHLEESENGEMTYEEIHETLAEEDVVPEDDPSFQLRLHHTYLPSMEEKDLIQYDEEKEKVFYVEDEDVEELLDALRSYED